MSSDDDDRRSRTHLAGTVPQPKPDFEVGVSSFLPLQAPYKNGGKRYESEDITVRQLVAMRRTDGQARALYRLITLPIRAALKTATFVPEDGRGRRRRRSDVHPADVHPARPPAAAWPSRSAGSWPQLLMAIFDGFEAFEMVYWQPTRARSRASGR